MATSLLWPPPHVIVNPLQWGHLYNSHLSRTVASLQWPFSLVASSVLTTTSMKGPLLHNVASSLQQPRFYGCHLSTMAFSL